MNHRSSEPTQQWSNGSNGLTKQSQFLITPTNSTAYAHPSGECVFLRSRRACSTLPSGQHADRDTQTRISILALARSQYTPALPRRPRLFVLNPAHHLRR